MLDFIVRYQEALITAFGTIVSALLLWLAVRGHPPFIRGGIASLQGSVPAQRFERGLESNFVTLAFLRESHSAAPASPRLPRRSILIIFVAIVIWPSFRFIGSLRPVPLSIGLKLPEIVHASPGNDALIIFLHGWNGGSVTTWQQFPTLAQSDKKFAKYDFLIINYPTYFVHRDLNITDLSEFIGKSLELDLHIFERYRSITVIAHSMGGLVAREIAIQHDLRRTPGRFTQLVEIATPHDGANAAYLAEALGISRETSIDVSHGSRFLAALRVHWDDFAGRPPSTCIGSPQDLVVPAASAEADCNERITYPQWGHTEMVKPADTRDYRYVLPTRYVR